MKTILHKFSHHQINPNTETLIIGTFNPKTQENEAEFFYGRARNYLWTLLPTAFDISDLKNAAFADKLSFIEKYKIDFIDLIEEIEIEEGQETNYSDSYIDSRVIKWKDIIKVIDSLPNLNKICFTRKTFSGIPKMKNRLDLIQAHCKNNGIYFETLVTPARFNREDKQIIWTKFLKLPPNKKPKHNMSE